MEDQTIDDSLKCSDKLAFDTQKQAEAAKFGAEYLHDAKGTLTTYICSGCGLYHLSSR